MILATDSVAPSAYRFQPLPPVASIRPALNKTIGGCTMGFKLLRLVAHTFSAATNWGNTGLIFSKNSAVRLAGRAAVGSLLFTPMQATTPGSDARVAYNSEMVSTG